MSELSPHTLESQLQNRTDQMALVLSSLLRGGKNVPESYTQITSEAKAFLERTVGTVTNLSQLDTNDYITLIHLINSPAPKSQETVLAIASQMAKKEAENPDEIRKVLTERITVDLTARILFTGLSEFPPEWLTCANAYNRFFRFAGHCGYGRYKDMIDTALAEAVEYKYWGQILNLFADGKYSSEYPELYQQALQQVTQQMEYYSGLQKDGKLKIKYEYDHEFRRKKWMQFESRTLKPLQFFFSVKQNILKEPKLYQQVFALTEFKTTEVSLIQPDDNKFLAHPVHQHLTSEKLNQEMMTQSWENFARQYHNWVRYHAPLEQALFKEMEEIRRTDQKYVGQFLEIFADPRIYSLYPEIAEELLDIVEKHPQSNNDHLLNFFKNPIMRKNREELFDRALNHTLQNNQTFSLTDFYLHDNNTPPESSGYDAVVNKLQASLNAEADKTLQTEIALLYYKYISDRQFPLNLLLLTPTERLPIAVSCQILGIDAATALNWKLGKQETASLTASLVLLASDDARRGMFLQIPILFKPLGSDQTIPTSHRHNLVEWFDSLLFFGNLPPSLNGSSHLAEHFERLKQLHSSLINTHSTQDQAINAAEIELSRLRNQLAIEFCRLCGIEHSVTFEEFQEFTKSWGGDIKSLVTLATHYNNSYKEGLGVLGKHVESAVRGTTYINRYDTTNKVTHEQLSPLLDLCTTEQQEKSFLEMWHHPNPRISIYTTDEKRKKSAEIDWSEIASELQSQMTFHGHNHVAELFKLPEFAHCTPDQQTFIEKILVSELGYFDSDVQYNIAAFKQILTNLKMPKEKIELLIRFSQLIRLVAVKNPDSRRILSSTHELIALAQDRWPAFANLECVAMDLGEFLVSQIQHKTRPTPEIENETVRSRLLLTAFTDHPKMLLEIGKYPNPSSCQNFESKGEINHRLLGYISDAQILAAVAVELLPNADVPLSELQNLTEQHIALDFGRQIAQLTLSDGSQIEVPFTKPKARNIVMLSKTVTDHTPYFLVENLYDDHDLDKDSYQDLLDQTIKRKQETFAQHGVKVLTNTENTPAHIQIGGSHNPTGHYNDLAPHNSHINTHSDSYTAFIK